MSDNAKKRKAKSLLDVGATVVEDGDLVVLYASPEEVWSLMIQNGEYFNCKYGNFRHTDIIGTEYGTAVRSCRKLKNRWGFLTVLLPSPELWTRTLGRRTQIIYLRDISMITFNLDLKPGSVVVESGTGSGSFSTSLARTIAPNGHLHTFEFHEERSNLARADFVRLGLSSLITVKHSDVLSNGFELPQNSVDAVFLDLPSPEKAIGHAAAVLKQGVGRICSFSPCIEQVQATCLALRQHKFHEIETVECLLQPMLLRKPDFQQISAPLSEEQKKLLADSGFADNSKQFNKQRGATQAKKRYRLTTKVKEARGHTSYLTFASMAVDLTAIATAEAATTTQTDAIAVDSTSTAAETPATQDLAPTTTETTSMKED